MTLSNGATPISPASFPSSGSRDGKKLSINGAEIFYSEAGQGKPILLVHGYPLSGALFGRIVPALSQSYRVITPDLRGFGQSSAPATTDTVDVYAKDMLTLMDKLGIAKATIGGMSMGGPVVLSMYKMAPDRFNGLLLIDTAFKKASPAEAGLWNGMATMASENGATDLIPFLLPQMLTGKTRTDDKAQASYLTAIIKEATTTGLISGAKALANRTDATELLGTIKVPTLVVVGEDDPLYGFEVAEMMQSKISGAQLHIVPDAAHAAIFEAPQDAGGAILAFVSTIRTASE
jgi:pimeloyl-ACP methyl ester carboxylesterase